MVALLIGCIKTDVAQGVIRRKGSVTGQKQHNQHLSETFPQLMPAALYPLYMAEDCNRGRGGGH